MALHPVEWLGRDLADWRKAEAALEAFVLNACPDEDASLIALLNAINGRAMQVFGSTAIGHSASNVTLPPTGQSYRLAFLK